MADPKVLRKFLRMLEPFEGVESLYPDQRGQLMHIVDEARKFLGDILPSYPLPAGTTSDNAKLFLKTVLASLRDELSARDQTAAATALAALDFGFVADDEIRAFAQQAHSELVQAFERDAIISVFVLSGAILEAVLLDRAGGTAADTRLVALIKTTNLDERIEPLRELAGMIRNYRNLIHPNAKRDRKVDLAQARVVAGLLITVIPAIAALK